MKVSKQLILIIKIVALFIAAVVLITAFSGVVDYTTYSNNTGNAYHLRETVFARRI